MSRGNEALLEAQSLSKHFGGTAALKQVSFSARAGEIVGLIGPNGAGKTTLLNLLSGVLRPSGGRVLFAGRDLTGMKTHAVARMQRQERERAEEEERIRRNNHVAANERGDADCSARLPALKAPATGCPM